VTVRTYRTNSEDETIALGRELAHLLPRPAAVLLNGNLGAGKTTIAKGIVEGLGVAEQDEVSSPTFALVHDYGGRVFHIDLYRLDTTREVESLGLDDVFATEDAVVLIEWGERFRHLIPGPLIEIDLHPVGDSRDIRVSGLK
jgi:tRNA threonylcarbamoyladenosine biosynthesis protein TsaE